MSKYLNVVSFDVPYPANYGGVIDVYYKLKALKENGVKVVLHCFLYNRTMSSELEEVCEEVHYYKRKQGIIPNLTFQPYIVHSRKNKELIRNLLKNDYPILFEGLHTCYYLAHSRLKKRVKMVRAHNIEHDYYYELMKNAVNPIKKAYFWLESVRLKNYYPNLKYANKVFAISNGDLTQMQMDIGADKVSLLPAFHKNEKIDVKEGKGDYILYHGNLGITENSRVASFIVKNIAEKSPLPIVIAGLEPTEDLIDAINSTPNVSLKANVSRSSMHELVQNAHIHLLYTHQDTGLKLKLVNTLFAGRYIVVNDLMVDGYDFGSSVVKSELDSDEIISKIKNLSEIAFDSKMLKEREEKIVHLFENNVEQIIRLI